MSSLALYRKYRPQRFSDVVGQTAVVRTLRNAIEQDKVAHAYLFTGPKGTGKTTMAKLLAKALNCESGPTVDPCGTCESCTSIAEGRSMDVLEIDAASNRGIDDVRDKIIDTVAFRPSAGTRRVYILDEAHQLTPAAFNALLKTIEEPPEHVLFAFCTTEAHQMIATVRDRCQRLTLSAASADDLFTVLTRVCATEGITADEPTLRSIARSAQGSFRNALGTLEMLSTSFGSELTHADVIAHLGSVREDLLLDAADAILRSDSGAVLRGVEELVQEGGDVELFARELAEHLRVLLLARNGVDVSSMGIGDAARVSAQAAAADERVLLSALDCMSDAMTRIRVGADPRITVETALVRACQGLGLPALALRIATLEHKLSGSYGQPLPGGAAGAAAGQVPAPPAQSAAAVAPSASTPTTTTAPVPVAHAPAPSSEAPATAAPASATASAPLAPAASAEAPTPIAALADGDAWWSSFVRVAANDKPLAPVAQGLQFVAADDTHLTISAAMPAMVTDRMKSRIRDHVKTLTGTAPSIEVQAASAAPQASPTDAAPTDASRSHPTRDAGERDLDLDRGADLDGAVDADDPAAPTADASAPAADDDGAALAAFQAAFDATEVPGAR